MENLNCTHIRLYRGGGGGLILISSVLETKVFFFVFFTGNVFLCSLVSLFVCLFD